MIPGTTMIDRSEAGKRAFSLPRLEVDKTDPAHVFPAGLLRTGAVGLPEVSEPEIARHFVNLSVLNHHVDRDFYPLGSCTMKYNPKVGGQASALPGFAGLHPLVPQNVAQGALAVAYELGRALCEITGMDDITMAPAAGAHGELTGMLMVRAYHAARGRQRKKVLIPDSAHGTNPASVAVAGYESVEVASGGDGRIDPEGLRAFLDEDVAAVMITNPNTLGLFETHICEVADLVHAAGGLVYLDGANMNALLGISRPGDFGADMVHLNLHKTFSTPHGGGGPGSGPVAVKEDLAGFLPVPYIYKEDDQAGGAYRLSWDRDDSIGPVHTFCGNFGVMVRAYCYVLMMGPEGMRRVAEDSLINANYLMSRLRDRFDIPYGCVCKHEFVASGKRFLRNGVRTSDIAKRLMDYGFHPPTVYFPLIVEEALMIEPTESESRYTLDSFADALIKISEEIESDPELVRGAPYNTPVRRVDEAGAARSLNVAQ
jgi:glycine dehydrogenase subunit 2